MALPGGLRYVYIGITMIPRENSRAMGKDFLKIDTEAKMVAAL